MNAIATLENVLDDLRKKGLYVPLELPAGDKTDNANESSRRTAKDGQTDAFVVPVRDLLSGNTLEVLIRRVARKMNTDNLVAAASLFQKRYTSVLLASVLTPMLRADIGILADSEHTEILLVDDLPTGMRLTDSSKWLSLSSGKHLRREVFKAIFDDNLGQLIYRIASEIGLSPMVMWGNAGNYVGYLHEQYAMEPVQRESAKEILNALLNGSECIAPPFSTTYQTVLLDELEPAQCVRVRSTCCLWYQFPGNENQPCITCPRLSRKERAERLALKG